MPSKPVQDYVEYQELVRTAPQGEFDVSQQYGEIIRRASKWADLTAKMIDDDYIKSWTYWRLDQFSVTILILEAIGHMYGESNLLQLPDNRSLNKFHSIFVPALAEALLRQATTNDRYYKVKEDYEHFRVKKDPPAQMDIEKLELSVAGTAFTMNSDEAALFVSVPCRLRGEEITILYPGSRTAVKTSVIARATSSGQICVAIFKRLRMRGAFDNLLFENEECDCWIFTGEHLYKHVTLQCGNITEVEVLDDEEE